MESANLEGSGGCSYHPSSPWESLRVTCWKPWGLGAPVVATSTLSSPGETKLVQPVLLGHTGYLLCQLRLSSHHLSFVPDIFSSLWKWKCPLYQTLTSRVLGQHFSAYMADLTGKNSPLTSVGQEKEIGRMSLVLSKCRCSFIQEILIEQILDSSRHYINISE